jgi:hypothetical protein
VIYYELVIQEAHSAKEACQALAERVIFIVSALHSKLVKELALDLSPGLQTNLNALSESVTPSICVTCLTSGVRTLLEIQKFMQVRAGWKWYKLVLNYRSIQRDIDKYNHRLDDCCTLFQVLD